MPIIEKASNLSYQYKITENKILEENNLNNILLNPALNRFLHNPTDEIIKEIFHPLFGLLSNNINTESFKSAASKNIILMFNRLFEAGYTKWVTLSIMQLLQAEKYYKVYSPKPEFDDEEVPVHLVMSPNYPEETETLSFNLKQFHAFLVPELLFFSEAVDKYIAIRSELTDAISVSDTRPESREWIGFDSARIEKGPNFLEQLILFYMDTNLKAISLIADHEKICRPELLIKCVTDDDWYSDYNIAIFQKRHAALTPVLGTYIVSLVATPFWVKEKFGQDCSSREIQFLDVGYDVAGLEPVIEKIKNPAC